MYTLDSKKIGRFTVTVGYDPTSEWDSPRDWDNGTTLCLVRRGYNLPNEGNIPFADLDTFADVLDYVAENFDVVGEVKTVSCYDHSGVRYFTGQPNDPWDSGIVGVIFMTKQGQDMVGTPDDLIGEVLDGDVETFSQWANGNIYRYEVTGPGLDDDDVELSLGGYYDDEEAMSEGVSVAQYYENKILSEADRLVNAFASLG